MSTKENPPVKYSPTVTAQEFFRRGLNVWNNWDNALIWNPDRGTWNKPICKR
jgi:hypothetical protein